MKIIVIGGTGTIGTAVASLLKQNHEVITVGRTSGDYNANLENRDSLNDLFNKIHNVDGVISLAGDAELAPYHSQPEEQIDLAINSKLRGNVDLIRIASNKIKKGGFIILTSGMAANNYMPGASSVSMSLAGLEAYIKAIQIEPYNDIRIQAIRPVIITETMKAFNLDLPFSVSAAETAEVYERIVNAEDISPVVSVSDFISNKENTLS